MDIKITQAAKSKILEEVGSSGIEPTVRIYVTSMACSGARFGLAFDEAKQFDVMTELEGIEFVTDSEYVPKFADGLSIDYVTEPNEGFIIQSLRPMGKACSTGGCKSGGCCGKS